MNHMGEVLGFGRRFMRTFFRKLGEFLWQQIVVSFAITAAILAEQIHSGVIDSRAVHANWWAFGVPYFWLLAGLFFWHFLRTAYVLHLEDDAKHKENAAQIHELSKAVDERGSLTQVTSKDWREISDKFGVLAARQISAQF